MAGKIASNIIIAWPSTEASIPSGWAREPALDNRYILGAAVGADADLTTDRGSTTHIHTSPSHVSIQDVHNHDIEAPDGYVTGTHTSQSGLSTPTVSTSAHGHGPITGDDLTAVNNAVSISVDATSNDPPYTTVIWIRSLGSASVFPAGCVAFFEADLLPSGWSRVYGNTFLKGADVGASGGTTGGNAAHSHTSPPHTHTQQAHSHPAINSDTGDGAIRPNTALVLDTPVSSHAHSISLSSTTATNQPVTTTISSAASEPPYKKLNSILSSTDDLPLNLIALWNGPTGSVPAGWTRYAAMNGYFHKGANADGESGASTGGVTQHSHTASDCQPVQNSHTHTAVDNGVVGADKKTANSGNASVANYSHTHVWTVTDTTATNQPTSVSIDPCAVGDAYPQHRTLIFIQLTTVPIPDNVHLGGYTSYDINRFFLGSPEDQILPEAAKKIAQHDLRFVPGRT